jgi:hypothetical protein
MADRKLLSTRISDIEHSMHAYAVERVIDRMRWKISRMLGIAGAGVVMEMTRDIATMEDVIWFKAAGYGETKFMVLPASFQELRMFSPYKPNFERELDRLEVAAIKDADELAEWAVFELKVAKEMKDE